MNLHLLRDLLLRQARLPITPLARIVRVGFSTTVAGTFRPRKLGNEKSFESYPQTKQFVCLGGLSFHSSPPSRIRTYDRLLKRELLYRLSYGRICEKCSRKLGRGEGSSQEYFKWESVTHNFLLKICATPTRLVSLRLSIPPVQCLYTVLPRPEKAQAFS